MIDHPNFSLKLGSPWLELPGEDPEQYNFRDEDRDIVITVSAMPLDLAADAIEQFAQVLVETRLHAESDAARAFDHRITIYEPIVVPRAWGSAVAYFGHDDTGRQFTYSGSVTRSCAISLYGSSATLSERELLAAIDELASKIGFDQTPLDGPKMN